MGRWRLPVTAVAAIVPLLWALDRVYPLGLPSTSDRFARVVVDRNGVPLRAFADSAGVWRYRITREQVAEHYLTALINYEDRWFRYHPGVNPFALLRALAQNLVSQRIVSGGSTLTMQVARLLHPHPRTLVGKLQQILRALQLEWHLDKDRILELYLNHAPFGGAREGVQAASYQYLGKPASELTLAESALLAVLPQAPSRLRPDRYPERARQARDKLLQRMLDFGVWDEQQVEQAKLEPVVAYTPERPLLAPLLARRLASQHPDKAVIHSTIDADLQQALQELAGDYVQPLAKGSSVAILVADESTHEVIAYVGTARFGRADNLGHVDMVRALRSPGSTLKPFLYGLALDAGLIHSQSLLADTPRQGNSYRPANFSGLFQGPVSVSQALRLSLNVPAVEVLEHLGAATFSDKLANAGLQLRLPRQARPNPAIILGGTGVTLEQLVSAYGAFRGQGRVHALQYTRDEPTAEPRFLMSPGAAWIVEDILRGIDRPGRVRSRSLRDEKQRIGWKSGTSYGFRDAWAIGFDGRYRVGVWVGRPDGTALPGHYGALTAAPLMFSTFDMLPDGPVPALPQPDTVSDAEICWPLGLRRSEQEPDWCHRTLRAWLLNGTAPRTLAATAEPGTWRENPYPFWINPDNGLLVDAACRVSRRELRRVALWPRRLDPWVRPARRTNRVIPATDPACPHPLNPLAEEMMIDGISDGASYRSPGQGLPIQLEARTSGGRGEISWYLNGDLLQRENTAVMVELELNLPGRYQLVAVDRPGNLAKVEFSIIP